MGRPSSFSHEIAAAILQRIADGESMTRICRDDDLPDRETVRRWMKQDESFAAECAHARVLQADALADDMAEIEDNTIAGVIDPAAARAVLASKQWRAAKLSPKVYGDSSRLELSGNVSVADIVRQQREKLK